MFAPVWRYGALVMLIAALAIPGSACRLRARTAIPAPSTSESARRADEQTAAAIEETAPAARNVIAETLTRNEPPDQLPLGVAPGGIYRAVRTDTKVMALTFDDGPSSNLPRILDALSRTGSRATFFVVGDRTIRHDDLLDDILAAGNELGDHSWHHQEVDADSTTPEIVRSLTRTQERLRAATGRTPIYFRPPAGKYDGRLPGITSDLGLATILWDIHSGDTNGDTAGQIVRTVVGNARPGGIVLMHETAPATVDALPVVISRLKAKGYTLVTLSELFSSGRPE